MNAFVRTFGSVFLAVGFSATAMGQTAHYTVNPDRSSPVIRGGTVDLVLVDAQAATLRVDYDVRTLVGPQRGSELRTLNPLYFSEDFWVNLREMKHYEDANAKVDHLGYHTIIIGNQAYPQCDYVHLCGTSKMLASSSWTPS